MKTDQNRTNVEFVAPEKNLYMIHIALRRIGFATTNECKTMQMIGRTSARKQKNSTKESESLVDQKKL